MVSIKYLSKSSLFNSILFDNFYQGGVTENFEFTINDDTEVYGSCSSLLNGEIFVFGGYYKKNQVIETLLIHMILFDL